MRYLVLSAVVAAFAVPDHADDKKAGPIGKPAYDFTLKTLDDKTIKLADMKGKVILIDFFETWCPACNKMMPGVVAMQARYKDQGLEVLAMHRGKKEADEKKVRDFAAKYKIEFPVAYLHGQHREEIINGYAVGPIPHFVVIDRKGVVRHTQAAGNHQVLENMVKKLLDEK